MVAGLSRKATPEKSKFSCGGCCLRSNCYSKGGRDIQVEIAGGVVMEKSEIVWEGEVMDHAVIGM